MGETLDWTLVTDNVQRARQPSFLKCISTAVLFPFTFLDLIMSSFLVDSLEGVEGGEGECLALFYSLLCVCFFCAPVRY